jgi:riboflavin synthase
MFTGLVEAVGELVTRREIDGGLELGFAAPIADALAVGDSVAVNGVCLTVTRAAAGEFRADVGPETARVTTLSAIAPRSRVNLERPLRADGRLGGHFVQGHVDGIGRIDELRPAAEFHWLTVRFPRALALYMVPKGSIAVDGISLTIAELGADWFRVQVVPYTIEHTNLARAGAGDRVNLEADILGKYVARIAELAGAAAGRGARAEAVEERS